MTVNLLEQGLDKLGISHNGTLDLLWKYIKEIELFNDTYGLVKVADQNELIIKHILDSLAPLARMVPGTIADVGSGAGLPGIPLAICLPQTQFTLIERMGRRAGFLRNCIAVLGLSNVSVEEVELEKTQPNRFDMAVFRAFRPLTQDILKSLVEILKPNGFLAAWKGRLENAQQEMLAAEKSVPNLSWEIIPLSVPFLEEERHLTVIEIHS